MGERTDDRPKCLVEVGGRSLLSRQVAALRGGGVTELGIARCYRAESISKKYRRPTIWMPTALMPRCNGKRAANFLQSSKRWKTYWKTSQIWKFRTSRECGSLDWFELRPMC